MDFVELNRFFVPFKKEDEPYRDYGPKWGPKLGGWLDWSDLLKHWRVVLLAEALSGKTTEFKKQAAKLIAEGRPAFFVSIEELADIGFEAALERGLIDKFRRWQQSEDEGWFFLDAVDEARLNKKNSSKC